jgi:hypothetical protein
MADRYVLRIHQIDPDLIAHQPGSDLVANITIETDLPKADVLQRLQELATEMDGIRG